MILSVTLKHRSKHSCQVVSGTVFTTTPKDGGIVLGSQTRRGRSSYKARRYKGPVEATYLGRETHLGRQARLVAVPNAGICGILVPKTATSCSNVVLRLNIGVLTLLILPCVSDRVASRN